HQCGLAPAATLAPALIALGATAEVQGAKGKKRTIELAKFFHAPTGPNEREHSLAPNELVLSVMIPNKSIANASYEVRHKQAYDWPLVQAAASFRHDGRATDVHIVLGHVAPTPIVAQTAAKALEGKEVSYESASAGGKAAA